MLLTKVAAYGYGKTADLEQDRLGFPEHTLLPLALFPFSTVIQGEIKDRLLKVLLFDQGVYIRV